MSSGIAGVGANRKGLTNYFYIGWRQFCIITSSIVNLFKSNHPTIITLMSIPNSLSVDSCQLLHKTSDHFVIHFLCSSHPFLTPFECVVIVKFTSGMALSSSLVRVSMVLWTLCTITKKNSHLSEIVFTVKPTYKLIENSNYLCPMSQTHVTTCIEIVH